MSLGLDPCRAFRFRLTPLSQSRRSCEDCAFLASTPRIWSTPHLVLFFQNFPLRQPFKIPTDNPLMDLVTSLLARENELGNVTSACALQRLLIQRKGGYFHDRHDTGGCPYLRQRCRSSDCAVGYLPAGHYSSR